MNEYKFPRVLVCAPTAKAKNYCFERWLDNVMSFTYPDFMVLLFDNTSDKGENAAYLNEVYTRKYGDFRIKFRAINSLKYNNVKNNITSVIEKMAMSHNDCRRSAIQYGFHYILHLESDVMPQRDVIEQLIFQRKQVIGAVYYRDEGIFRKPTLQRNYYRASDNVGSLNLDAKEDLLAVDGTVKQFAAVGLGCVLISSSVLKKIPFRWEKNRSFHPDTYFSEDCYRNKIPIYADTALLCSHDNRPWGRYGEDFH